MVENNLQENHVVENNIPCVLGCVIVNQVRAYGELRLRRAGELDMQGDRMYVSKNEELEEGDH